TQLEARVGEAPAKPTDRVDIELRCARPREDERTGPDLVADVERAKPDGLDAVGTGSHEGVVLPGLDRGALGSLRVADVRLSDAIGFVRVEGGPDPAEAGKQDFPVQVRLRNAGIVGLAGRNGLAANGDRDVESGPVFDARDRGRRGASRGDGAGDGDESGEDP